MNKLRVMRYLVLGLVAPAFAAEIEDPEVRRSMELVEAAEEGNLAKVQELLRQSVNINETWHSKTALTAAAERGDSAMVDLLIHTPGIDVNSKDRQKDNTALVMAIRANNPDTVRLLAFAHGIELDRRQGGRRQWTPLEYAESFAKGGASEGRKKAAEIVEILTNALGKREVKELSASQG
jgi:ankyrin repeat protein